MSKIVLKVPHSHDANDWFQFINESLGKIKDAEELVVDFNLLTFIDTDDFVALACLIESFYIKCNSVTFIGGGKKLNIHLNNIKFKEYWNKGFNRERFTAPKNGSTLCLWKISKDMIDSYSQYARTYFRETFSNLNNKDLLPVSTNLTEVFNNIFDHSQSPVQGYVITQYFPQKNILSFSVCDFGVGIPNTVNDYLARNNSERLSDQLAIHKAIEVGFSIKSTPRNRGFGLDNILEATEDSNGELSIISNNGIISKKAKQKYKGEESGFNFKGTLVKVILDMSTFGPIDEEDMIFEF